MDQEIAGPSSSSLPPFSSLCSSSVESLLNALFPDDETLKDHLNYPETLPTNEGGDHNMDDRYDFNQFLDTNVGFHEQPTQYSPPFYNNQGYDAYPSNSMIDTLDQLLASTFVASSPTTSSSPCFSSYTSSIANSPVSYSPSTSRPSSYQPESNFPQIQPAYSQSNDNQANFSAPTSTEFRPAIKVNTPHSKTNEPWKASVAKKILEAYYSPLSLKSEFLATQIALDEFQSLAIKEAVAAFHDVALCTTSIGPDVCTAKFVNTCSKVRAYRRLHIEDKVTLLTNVFFDTIAMKSIITYDHLTDSWNASGKKVDRREIYRLDPILHDNIVNIIQTYPDRWRNDLTAAAIIYLIVIFNPDLPNLKFSDSIRCEQYGYIYLLKRYLEVACESPCDASDYLYRLMCKIEEIQSLRKQMIALLDSVHIGLALPIKNLIITMVK